MATLFGRIPRGKKARAQALSHTRTHSLIHAHTTHTHTLSRSLSVKNVERKYTGLFHGLPSRVGGLAMIRALKTVSGMF
jgi:hypothetical protein